MDTFPSKRFITILTVICVFGFMISLYYVDRTQPRLAPGMLRKARLYVAGSIHRGEYVCVEPLEFGKTYNDGKDHPIAFYFHVGVTNNQNQIIISPYYIKGFLPYPWGSSIDMACAGRGEVDHETEYDVYYQTSDGKYKIGTYSFRKGVHQTGYF